MNENQKFNNLYILVSAFIHELGGPFTLTKDEFYEIKAMIRMGKVEAIKHLRHITRINEETLFNEGDTLEGANLSRANLSRADLSRADLSRADLSGANLKGMK